MNTYNLKLIFNHLSIIISILIAFMLTTCAKSDNVTEQHLRAPEPTSLTSQSLNAFVDLSHLTTNVDFSVAKANGLVGVIHKATQHTDFEDNAYGNRVAEARELGLLVGAYHFGSAADPAVQVDFFLSTIRKYGAEGIVPVIDWEPNPLDSQGTMTKEHASQFIEIFYQKTGIYPVLYGGYWMLHQLRDETDVENFAKAPLWQGFYSSAVGYLTDIWSNWTFIQYTDGIHGPEPREFPGMGAIDRDMFNGSLEDAQKFWEINSLKQ